MALQWGAAGQANAQVAITWARAEHPALCTLEVATDLSSLKASSTVSQLVVELASVAEDDDGVGLW